MHLLATELPASEALYVSISVISSTSLNISWQLQNTSKVHGVIVDYHVHCSNNQLGTSSSSQTSNNSTKHKVIDGLHAYTPYECCVAASNLRGAGNKTCSNATTSEAGITTNINSTYI